MKSVLISIKPKYCELIANGKKTVEVRKTKPELETPFKVYIYCTKGKFEPSEYLRNNLHYDDSTIRVCEGQGKVIGEFVCDRIIDVPYSQYFVDYYHTMPQEDLEATCLDMGHIDEYLLSKNGYGWHISDLVIYDKPKELSGFATVCEGLKPYQCDKCEYSYTESNESIGVYHECCCNNLKPLKRPPQSWCYAETKGENK